MTNFRPLSSQNFPPVVKNLIIINALVFLLQQVAPRFGIDLENMLALHYWASPLFRWWQPLTYMFLHGNFMHILLNMYGLWMFGCVLEQIWGAQRFITFYTICGFGAALCQMGVQTWQLNGLHDIFLHFQENPNVPDAMQLVRRLHIPLNGYGMELAQSNPAALMTEVQTYYMNNINEATIGASGAIFGILFAFGYLFPNTEMYIIFLPIPIKAKWLIGGYAVIELLQGVNNSAGDNVAHFAHLGGMLFAFVLLRIWKTRRSSDFY